MGEVPGGRGRDSRGQPHDNASFLLLRSIFVISHVASHWKISQIIKLLLDGAEPFSIRTTPFYKCYSVLYCKY